MSGPVYKLSYYNAPGKAEPIRIALDIAGVNWENNFITGATWGPMKKDLLPSLPQANVPLLEVDGQYLAESKAILRYAGALGGGKLIPSDLFAQARMDEALSLTDDIPSAFFPVIFAAYPDEASKFEARAAVCRPDGKLYKCMEKFEAFVAALNGNFVCGDQLTVADLSLFCTFNMIVCGMFDGFPLDFFDAFPAIQAYRKKVGTVPEISGRYTDVTEGPLATAFKF